MPRSAMLGTLLAAIAAIGCSPSSQLRPAPPSDGAAPDSGPDVVEDARADAGDAADAAPRDATPDALDGQAGDAGPWCAGQGLHLFCDDFDEAPLAQSWDQIENQHGTPKLDTTAYTSPFESMLATTTALGSGAVAAVGLSKRVTYLATELHLAFDMRIDALDPSAAPIVLCELQMLDGVSNILEIVNVIAGPGGASVEDTAPALDGGPDWDHTYALDGGAALPVGQWARVKLDILLPGYDAGMGAAGTLTVHVGSAPAPAVDHVPISPGTQLAQPFFYLGIVSASGPSAPVAARFDDVTFDVQP
jgi:hypothetical protein